MAKPDADKLLVECVEALEEYLTEHEVASVMLKQGFLKLTKAKLRLPEHVLTEISYHEEFEASRVMMLDSEGNWRLRDASEVKIDKKNNGDPSSSLQHRKAGKSSQEKDATVTSNTGLNVDTLLWFSSLPPSDLRQAQKQFVSGLQALLVVASSAEKVQRAVHGV